MQKITVERDFQQLRLKGWYVYLYWAVKHVQRNSQNFFNDKLLIIYCIYVFGSEAMAIFLPKIAIINYRLKDTRNTYICRNID